MNALGVKLDWVHLHLPETFFEKWMVGFVRSDLQLLFK